MLPPVNLSFTGINGPIRLRQGGWTTA